jgi:hypothetical protein
MTTPQPDPPLAADELAATGTEREVLEAFLDFHRDVLVRKVAGVSEQEARYRRVPSRTTLAGLVKHMIGVERGWFQCVLAERLAGEIGPNVGGGDESWELAEDETVQSLAEGCGCGRMVAGVRRRCGRRRRWPGGPAEGLVDGVAERGGGWRYPPVFVADEVGA